jgi:hypothetical protein
MVDAEELRQSRADHRRFFPYAPAVNLALLFSTESQFSLIEAQLPFEQRIVEIAPISNTDHSALGFIQTHDAGGSGPAYGLFPQMLSRSCSVPLARL